MTPPFQPGNFPRGTVAGGGGPRHRTQGSNSRNLGCLVVGGVGLLLLVVTMTLLPSSDQNDFTSSNTESYQDTGLYSGEPIPRFTAADSERLSQQLGDSARAHDMCFGWRLVQGGMAASGASGSAPTPEDVDVGSNRGAGVPADTCESWAEVRTTVAYGSGDEYDAADIDIDMSDDMFDDMSALITADDFISSGITADTLVEEPVSATGQAAMSLPLLLIEEGALNPVDPTDPGDQGQDDGEQQDSAEALPQGGNDGGWVPWSWLGVLSVLTVFALVAGFRARSRQRNAPRSADFVDSRDSFGRADASWPGWRTDPPGGTAHLGQPDDVGQPRSAEQPYTSGQHDQPEPGQHWPGAPGSGQRRPGEWGHHGHSGRSDPSDSGPAPEEPGSPGQPPPTDPPR